ncbi:HAD-IC family P-type ATPase [Tessaracoccus coleopterorum]|uniref:HAD-IC family P-type ATPase n=1 Tax=Tessaracoccus coleopterorum TaxID=2714950 RepID=UPI0038CD22BB
MAGRRGDHPPRARRRRRSRGAQAGRRHPPESAEAVAALQASGIQVVMITGDAHDVAASVARELGIDRVFAGVRPEDKASKVAELQAEGRKVAMVGDGVNDAPRWPPPTSASPSAQAPTWRSRRQA